MRHLPLTAAALSLLSVAACSKPAEQTTVTNTTETTGVTREEVAPAPTPAAAPSPAAAIQSGTGPEGNTVALDRVAVTGDILTVSMTFSGGDGCCVHIPIDDVSVIDDTTSQRISVLKDNTGKPMAMPLEGDGKSVSPTDYDKPAVVWFKFPAPPATSKTVSIAVPGVTPFDAVPVTR